MRVSTLGILLTALLGSAPAAAVEYVWKEGDLRGYPTLFDPAGQVIGKGEFIQRNKGGRLEVTATYRYRDGRRTEERAVFDTRRDLVQTQWSFIEHHQDREMRRFELDLTSGQASWMKVEEDGEVERGQDKLDDAMRRDAFAGIGISFAAKNLIRRDGTVRAAELKGIAFTPKPRAIGIEITQSNVDTIGTGARKIDATRVTIHPKVPAIAELFVDAPDTTLWFSRATPPQLLRVETTIAEPSDPRIVINLFGSGGKLESPPDEG
jgi:hypothetical protein